MKKACKREGFLVDMGRGDVKGSGEKGKGLPCFHRGGLPLLLGLYREKNNYEFKDTASGKKTSTRVTGVEGT